MKPQMPNKRKMKGERKRTVKVHEGMSHFCPKAIMKLSLLCILVNSTFGSLAFFCQMVTGQGHEIAGANGLIIV